MPYDGVQQWLDQVESARASQSDTRNYDRPKHIEVLTSPSTSLLPFGTAIKRNIESQLSEMEAPKRPRRGEKDTEIISVTSASILPLRDDLTLSPSVTTTTHSKSRQRSPSPSRHKKLLECATPRVRYIPEWDPPGDGAAQELRDSLSETPHNWQPDLDKIKEVVAGARKCVIQQRSESSWVTEVIRPVLQVAIGDLPLESWGVYVPTPPLRSWSCFPRLRIPRQSEMVGAEYQPRYTTRDSCNRKIDWVVGFPKEQWESLYARAISKYPDGYLNHVDHPHTGTQVLGCGCEIKPPNGDLIEAQVQLGVWMAGFFSWAFRNWSGDQTPPPTVGFIPVGETWGFYIVYGVQEGTDHHGQRKLGEVCVWGPLPELDGRPTSDKLCSSLVKTLRRVMEYLCGRYVVQLQESVFT